VEDGSFPELGFGPIFRGQTGNFGEGSHFGGIKLDSNLWQICRISPIMLLMAENPAAVEVGRLYIPVFKRF